MENIILQSALKYREMDLSVIPVKANKKPYLDSWKPFQTEKADLDRILQWWERWPKANIGIVTGEVSGLTVIDIDSTAGQDAIDEFLPDTLLTPAVKTPNGKHLYFQHTPGISNAVRIITDCDVRNDGGYVVAPPSRNGKGHYAWLDGLKPTDLSPASMPGMLAEILRDTSAHSSAHIKKSIPSRREGVGVTDPKTGSTRRQPASSDPIGFAEGQRDNSLFHLANCCIKGGMDPVNAEKYLRFFADHCNPPFPENEIPAKIKSAINRNITRTQTLAQEIDDVIAASTGVITTSFVHQTASSDPIGRREKKAINKILARRADQGVLERTGRRAGEYRIVENNCDSLDWINANTEIVDIWQPFGLPQIAKLQPGNIIVYAGSPNSGKTGVFLNIAKENLSEHRIHYFSSEMGREEFKSRMKLFSDVTLDMLSGINLYSRYDNFQDVLRPGPGNINIIDYLEMPDNFYLVGKHLAGIHEKLDGAIAVVGLQKERGRDTGRGASFSLEKPRLYISLDSGVARIVKCKAWQGSENPNGKEYHFKLVDGCRFIRKVDWHSPAEK